jgi:hypothetical protein
VKAVIIFLFILIPFLAYANSSPKIFMPGALLEGHENISCKSCHDAFNGAKEEKCTACHLKEKPIIQPEKHGNACFTCHGEHMGKDVRITQFDHAKIYEMSSKHAELKCKDCHSIAFSNFSTNSCIECHEKKVNFNMSKHLNYFGDSCLTCHRKIAVSVKDFKHKKYEMSSKFANLACRDCHSPGFKSFLHNKTNFVLGEHAELKCKDCHLTNFKFLKSSCRECHTKDMNIKRHVRIFGETCLDCHSRAGIKDFDHSRLGFEIGAVVSAHGEENMVCRDCHPKTLTLKPTCDSPGCHYNEKILREHLEHGVTRTQEQYCLECHIIRVSREGYGTKMEED